MKARGLRLDASILVLFFIVLAVVAALLSGFDVINGGYSQPAMQSAL